MSNSGTGKVDSPLGTSEVTRARNRLALERRERFAAKHPEIDIQARRENGGRLAFYVTAPDLAIAWFDATCMMDELESRYPDE